MQEVHIVKKLPYQLFHKSYSTYCHRNINIISKLNHPSIKPLREKSKRWHIIIHLIKILQCKNWCLPYAFTLKRVKLRAKCIFRIFNLSTEDQLKTEDKIKLTSTYFIIQRPSEIFQIQILQKQRGVWQDPNTQWLNACHSNIRFNISITVHK